MLSFYLIAQTTCAIKVWAKPKQHSKPKKALLIFKFDEPFNSFVSLFLANLKTSDLFLIVKSRVPMTKKWYESKVIRIENESPNTKRFWLAVQEEEKLTFKPGQYVTMDLPIHEKRLKRLRSYSIANPPDGNNILEFCIVQLESGAATTYFFNEVKLGASILFKPPAGVFVLPEPVTKDLVFICTGTGVAPFRSMIFDLVRLQKPHQKLHLIFGTRYENGILYRQEFEKLQQEVDNFQYSVVLSRESNWQGKKGYVHSVYMEQYQQVRDDVSFYLCGWSNMIDDAVENLIVKLGYAKEQVHYELYG